MDVKAFLDGIRNTSDYADQIVYLHEEPDRQATYAQPDSQHPSDIGQILHHVNIERLYCHQAAAIQLAGDGKDILIATGTASGKTLCYALPIIANLQADPGARALLLFPTKALCQDQFKNFSTLLQAAGFLSRVPTGSMAINHRLGYVMIALVVPAGVALFAFLRARAGWLHYAGPAAYLAFIAFMVVVEYVWRVEFRSPMRPGILVPYLILFFGAILLMGLPMFRMDRRLWLITVVTTVLLLGSMGVAMRKGVG